MAISGKQFSWPNFNWMYNFAFHIKARLALLCFDFIVTAFLQKLKMILDQNCVMLEE